MILSELSLTSQSRALIHVNENKLFRVQHLSHVKDISYWNGKPRVATCMLLTAIKKPDPVLIFENVMLYNRSEQLAANAGPVDIDKAAIRRAVVS